MKTTTIAICTMAAACLMDPAGTEAFAQAGRYSSPYGNYSSGGISKPGAQRKLSRSKQPILSPDLNLIPGAASSFTGQYLLRTIPQQEFLRNQAQTERALEGLQSEINTQQKQIQSGLSTTGHRTSFLSTGGYFSRR
jgi:hypothetical protein